MGAEVGAGVGSSESAAGISESGKGRFLLFMFTEEGTSGVGSAVVGTWELDETSAPPVPALVSIAVVASVEPVGGRLVFLAFFFLFLVVATRPAVEVNRVSGHTKEMGDHQHEIDIPDCCSDCVSASPVLTRGDGDSGAFSPVISTSPSTLARS